MTAAYCGLGTYLFLVLHNTSYTNVLYLFRHQSPQIRIMHAIHLRIYLVYDERVLFLICFLWGVII